MKNLEKYINEYIDESLELLDNICDEFIELEKESGTEKAEVYKSIYRSMHTIKGSSQLYGIHHVGNVAHGLETCLDSVRKGKVKLSKKLLDCILVAIDYIRKKLESLYDHSKLTPENLQADQETLRIISIVFAEICEKINIKDLMDAPVGVFIDANREIKYLKARGDGRPHKESVEVVQNQSDENNKQTTAGTSPSNKEDASAVSLKKSSATYGIIGKKSSDIPVSRPKSKSLIKKKKVSLEDIEGVKFGSFGAPPKKKQTASKQQDSNEQGVKPLQDQEHKGEGETGSKVNEVGSGLRLKPEVSNEAVQDPVSDTVRVPVNILNNLMNLIGELILIRNQLLQLNSQDREFGDVYSQLGQSLNVLTNKLQNEILKTRLQPINLVFSKLKRSVRDYSRNSDKSVRLDISGQNTEVDKTILESIEEPICQLAKIAVLTGIEAPSARARYDKPEQGVISVNARREGGQIIVTVEDDGSGQDLERIKTLAIKHKLLSEKEASCLDNKATLYFLFTKKVAQEIFKSIDEGCRLDFVKESLEKFGGSIDIESKTAEGTKYTLKLPLTLTILPALIVQAKEDMFVIPQANLVELSRIDLSEDRTSIDWLGGSPIYRQRGRILPLLFLSEVLEGRKDSSNVDFKKLEVVNLVILSAGNCKFGLIVDQIINSTDIVIKPLIKFLTKSTIYSGATIMGDGKIALTLDVLRLANQYNLMQNIEHTQHIIDQHHSISESRDSQMSEYLLIDIGIPGYYGVPLELVNRLEEIDKSKVFYKGKTKVINYRHKVMPLIPSSGVKKDDNYKLIVLKMAENFYGLEVVEFMDIIRSNEPCQESEVEEDHIKGSILHKEKVINILDINNMVSHLKSRIGKQVA